METFHHSYITILKNNLVRSDKLKISIHQEPAMPSLVIHLKETLIYVYRKPGKILSTALFETGTQETT